MAATGFIGMPKVAFSAIFSFGICFALLWFALLCSNWLELTLSCAFVFSTKEWCFSIINYIPTTVTTWTFERATLVALGDHFSFCFICLLSQLIRRWHAVAIPLFNPSTGGMGHWNNAVWTSLGNVAIFYLKWKYEEHNKRAGEVASR